MMWHALDTILKADDDDDNDDAVDEDAGQSLAYYLSNTQLRMFRYRYDVILFDTDTVEAIWYNSY